MNELIIQEAQDFLIVRKDADEYRHIVDIRHLLKKHSVKEVADFLKECLREKEKALRNMILIDKSNRRIDKFAGSILRLTLAIKVLEREEVNIIETSESGAVERGILQERCSYRRRKSRKWENNCNHGKGKSLGNTSQCIT